MKHLIFALCCALSACANLPTNIPASPSTVADSTVLDEKAAISIETAYKAARVAIETATDAGIIKGATASKAAILDNQAYSAVQAVRTAYRAGNSASYVAALHEAQSAIRSFLAVVKG